MATSTRCDVAVVGAGLAGLVAARILRGEGLTVALYDEALRPGGRCATRRVGGAVVDSGAQFFTIRSPDFQHLVDSWHGEGCPIRVWADGFAQAQSIAENSAAADTTGDGYPRYSLAGGMNGLAAHLARDLDVRLSVRVAAVRSGEAGWGVEDATGGIATAGAVIITPPLPQALALLDAGGVRVDDDLRTRGYVRSLAVLAALDRPPGLPPPGGVQFAEGPVSWLGDNVAKGASEAPAVTIHAAADYSALHFDDEAAVATNALLDLAGPWLAPAQPVATELVRWRYSGPVKPGDAGAVRVAETPGPLLLAGDAHAGAKVEGAVTSGLAAARMVLEAR